MAALAAAAVVLPSAGMIKATSRQASIGLSKECHSAGAKPNCGQSSTMWPTDCHNQRDSQTSRWLLV